MVNFWAVADHLTWHYGDIVKFSWGDVMEWTFPVNTKCHVLNKYMHKNINKIYVIEMHHLESTNPDPFIWKCQTSQFLSSLWEFPPL